MKNKQKKKPFCECALIDCKMECKKCKIFARRKRK